MKEGFKILIFLLFLAILHPGFGQARLDSLASRDDMVGEIMVRVYRTKIPSAISMVNEFQSFWDAGGLNENQKTRIEEIYGTLNERGLPTNPYLFFLLRTIINAGGNELVDINPVTEILDVTLEVIRYEKADKIKVYFRNLNDFLTHKSIHFSNGYKLHVDNIDISFEYIPHEAAYVEEPPPLETPEDDMAVEAEEESSPDDADSWANDWDNSGDNWATDDSWDDATNTNAEDDSWATQSDPWSDDGWGNDTGANDPSDSWGQTETSDDPWGAADQGGNENSFQQQVEDDQYLIDAITDIPMPPEEGPVIRFKQTDLIFQTHYDTVALKGSKGVYLMTTEMYIGEGGRFDWSSQGLNRETVFCDLGKYAFSVLRPEFKSTKSVLTHADKLGEAIEGTFSYKSVNRHGDARSTYPRFMSYKHDIRVYFPADNNLVFKGGFSLIGNKMTSKSLLNKDARLEVKHEGGVYFRASGPLFELSDSLISSENVRVTLYNGSDTLFHPSVALDYQPGSRELQLTKNEGMYHITPYTLSYFEMTIMADRVSWDLDEDSLDISISSAQNIVPAYFESKDYFNRKDMKSLAGIYDFHPLIMTVHYSRQLKSRHFNVYDLADAYNQNENAVKATMITLKQNGFINYNPETGEITLKDKAFHYVDANSFNKDYDDLKIKSLSPLKPNATLRLDEKEIVIRGINRFYISEILDVFIYPENNEITLLRDRDLQFDGQLFSGNFEFIGREFLFNYDSFLVDMTTIDSIRFYIDNLDTGEKEMVDNKLVTSGDSTSQEMMDGLSQEFADNSGRLYINRPNNKSGQKIYPNYPRFNAEKGAVVYFDNKEVLDGAYDKSMYFVIPPFQIDSLSGSDPTTIGFDGKFIAEGMLPPFEETLHIMDDNSLGFDHMIAPEGYELYEGTGKIYNKLRMDKNGLTASGSVNYISSSFDSDQLTLFMDSVTGYGTGFQMQAGTYGPGSFPDASVDEFRLKWLPKKDSMQVTSLETPFNLYQNTASLDGTLTVSQQGGFGKGSLLTRGAEARSSQFSFNENRFGARHAFFEIKSDNPEKPALSGDDIRLNFNLVENYADIGPEIEGVAAINFPYAQFKTSISNARWNLDDRRVVMNKPDDVDISNSYFYATREELDSLVFNASKAVYDIDKLELLISGIPYINVADAKITPENNEVLVLENARIGTLYNTTIVIDTLNEYHRLYDGTIDIISRNKFEGRATYQFVNAVNDTFAIKIDEFLLVEEEDSRAREKPLHTQAMGYIFEEDGVVISPGMLYKGEAIMYAPDPAFELNGYVKLEYRTNLDKDIWIRYQSSETETQEVKFDFEKARTENDEPLVAGIHYDEADRLYTTFVNDKKSIMDRDFFSPQGILSFDADSSMYKIEDTLKINGVTYSGRIFNLNVNTSNLQFEGPVDFNLLTDDFEINGSAIGSGNIEKNTYRMDAFLTMDFKLPPQAYTAISMDMLNEVELMGPPIAYNDEPRTLYKVAEIIGERATSDFAQRSLEEYVPLVSMSGQLMKTLVLSEADLTWSEQHKAWYSKDKIGISNIMRDDINALVDGFLEIKKNETGDVINIFLQFSPACWYFFNFEENRLITASSNEDYLGIVADKSDALKADFGEYFFLDGEYSDAMRFIDRFRSEYLGIDEPYELDFSPAQQAIPLFQEPQETDDGFQIPEEVEEEEEDDDGF